MILDDFGSFDDRFNGSLHNEDRQMSKIWCHSGGDRHSLGGFFPPSPKGVSLDTS